LHRNWGAGSYAKRTSEPRKEKIGSKKKEEISGDQEDQCNAWGDGLGKKRGKRTKSTEKPAEMHATNSAEQKGRWARRMPMRRYCRGNQERRADSGVKKKKKRSRLHRRNSKALR